MAQLDCIIEGQSNTSGILGEFSTNSTGYAGKAGSYYYTNVIKFTVPDFVGLAKDITFGLYLSSSFASGHTLRVAITSSLENIGRYINAIAPIGEVSEPNQVSAGQTPTFENVTTFPKYYTFSLDGSKLAPGTYYLVLWASTVVGMNIQATVSAYGNATAVLSYENGVVHIDDGNEILVAVCYIEIDGEQVQAVPYIDTGTDWKIGG